MATVGAVNRIAAADVGGSWIRVAGPGVPTSAPVLVPTPPHIDDIAPTVLAAVSERGWTDLEALGLGCAGIVDHSTGMLRWMPHAAGRDAPLGTLLAESLQVPVWVDNDANAAALAEANLGSGMGARVVLLVTVGTGIGAGLVIDGRIERGRGHLGEVGHMKIGSDWTCVCGRCGCWEAVASGRALDAAARGIDPNRDGSWLLEAAGEDGEAAAAVDQVARWLAVGIGNLALVLDPDVLIVGGGAGPGLLEAARRHLGSDGGSLGVTGLPPIVPARFGAGSGLEGAIIGATEVTQ